MLFSANGFSPRYNQLIKFVNVKMPWLSSSNPAYKMCSNAFD